MNAISSPQKGDPGYGRTSEEGIQESIYPNHHEVNITDGGEFLDDAIRMKDQLLGEANTIENE
jgi:hypothetical protein